MSNRRRLRQPPPSQPGSALLAALDGAEIAGGCDGCDAYQKVRAHAYGANVHMISVHHDDGCPWLAAREQRGSVAR